MQQTPKFPTRALPCFYNSHYLLCEEECCSLPGGEHWRLMQDEQTLAHGETVCVLKQFGQQL